MDKAIKKRIEQIARGEAPEGYEKTAFGIFPCDWGKHKIAEIFEIYSGGTPDTTQVKYWDGDIPWCVPTDITGCGKYIAHTARNITQLGLSNSAAILIPSGSILMCSRATIGPRCINIIPMATNQGFKNLVCKENNSIEFFYYYLDILLKQFLKNSSGSTFLELAKGVLSQQLCVIPNEKEQEKIAEILQTQDRLIELKEKLIAEKYKQKQYLMDVLLTGKVRLPGFSDDWERVELKKVSTMCSGGTPSTENEEYYGGEYIWVSIADMTASAKYLTDSNKKLSELGLNNCSARLFPAGTVLFAMYASIGECVIAGKECATSQAILGITPDNKKLNNEFLYYALKQQQNKIVKMQQASSQPNLNKSLVESIIINVPSLKMLQKGIKEQEGIVKVLSMADAEIDALKEELILQRKQRDALMQLLLTGIVRVKYE